MGRQFRAMAVLVVSLLAGTLTGCAEGGPSAQADTPSWAFAGNNIRNTRSADGEHVLTTANVSQLAPLWSTTVQGGLHLATPTSDGESLFLGSDAGILYRIERKTGQVAWKVDLATALAIPGASSKMSVAVTPALIVVGLQNRPVVAAFAKKDGALVWKQTIDAHPLASVTQSPIVVGGRIFIGVSGFGEENSMLNPNYTCCSFRGSEVALDLANGKMLWKTYTIPKGYAGASIWSSTPAFDAKRNTLFVGTGNNFAAPPEVVKCGDENKDNPAALAKCTPDGVWFDSILALNADTGAIKWGRRFEAYDVFALGCLFSKEEGGTSENCPGGGHNGKGDFDFGHAFSGDYDFANGAMLWHIDGANGGQDVVGAGQKSGTFWALDRDTGKVLWERNIGPGGPGGGMEMGSATDGKRAYVAESNFKNLGHKLHAYELPSGQVIKYGSYAALDAATGKLLWQVPDPAGVKYPGTENMCTLKGDRSDCAGAYTRGPVSTANGIVFACSLEPEGHMYALNGATGALLWSYRSGTTCQSGASIIDGVVYWVGGRTLYAFGIAY